MVRLLIPAQHPLAEVRLDAHNGPAIPQVAEYQLIAQLSTKSTHN
jgi:hypothetical protein